MPIIARVSEASPLRRDLDPEEGVRRYEFSGPGIKTARVEVRASLENRARTVVIREDSSIEREAQWQPPPSRMARAAWWASMRTLDRIAALVPCAKDMHRGRRTVLEIPGTLLDDLLEHGASFWGDELQGQLVKDGLEDLKEGTAFSRRVAARLGVDDVRVVEGNLCVAVEADDG